MPVSARKAIISLALSIFVGGQAAAGQGEILNLYGQYGLEPAPLAAAGAPDEATLIEILRLRDPYIEVLPPAETAERSDRFGIHISLVGSVPLVTANAGTPAAEHIPGIAELLALDGISTEPGNPLPDLASKQEVDLLLRDGPDQLARRITLKRSLMPEPAPVEVETHGDVILLRLHEFRADHTADAIGRALVAARPSDIVLLDLRLNAGGSLFEALDAASLFLQPGLKVGETVAADGRTNTYFSTESPHARPHQLAVVLVSDHTASAAESFVRALDHYGRALVVGMPTFGKCRSQVHLRLRNGRRLAISNLKMLDLSGSDCEGKPINPAIRIEPPDVYNTAKIIDRMREAIYGDNHLNYICLKSVNTKVNLEYFGIELEFGFDWHPFRQYVAKIDDNSMLCLGPEDSKQTVILSKLLLENYSNRIWVIPLQEIVQQSDLQRFF